MPDNNEAGERDPEAQSEREVEEEATKEPEDQVTRREALELDLMAKGRSSEGEQIP